MVRFAAWSLVLLALSFSAQADSRTPIRLLALGDSFTIGTGSRPDQAFPERVASRWRARKLAVDVDDPAVNGYSTRELIDRELDELSRFKPNLVTLAIGANDIVRGRELPEFRANLRIIFAAIQAAGVAPDRIWVIPQPDWSQSPTAREFGEPATFAAQIHAYNAALHEEAHAVGARWIELTPLMSEQARKQLLAPDGLHPSTAAYDAWAEEIAKQL